MSDCDSIDDASLLRHEAWVRRPSRELVQDDLRGEDLVQETWLAASQSPPESDDLEAWLGLVLRRRAGRARGDRQREQRERAVARPTVGVDEAIQKRELQ